MSAGFFNRVYNKEEMKYDHERVMDTGSKYVTWVMIKTLLEIKPFWSGSGSIYKGVVVKPKK